MSIRVFCEVAEQRSFTGAAERLGISLAMASKHVKHLEERLNARLLNRSSRHVSPSEAGLLYLDRARPLLDALGEVEASVSRTNAVPYGILRLSAPVWLASGVFPTMLADYRLRFPEVRFDVDLSGRIVDLLDEGYDLALRASHALDPGLVARHLADIRFLLVASPRFLDTVGRPKDPRDLDGQPLLSYAGLPADGRVPSAERRAEAIRFDPVLRTENEDLLRRAALAHMGYTFLPMVMLADDLAAGRLELVLGTSFALPVGLYAVYPSRRFLSAKVRTFLDFLAGDARLR